MRALRLEWKDVAQGPLVLINPDYPLLREPEADRLMPVGAAPSGIMLDRQAAVMLAELMALLCCEDGIVPVSGYRTMKEQQRIYAQSMRDNGPIYTRKYVALPGCSEHQSGLAIDLAEKAEQIDFIAPRFPDEGVCLQFKRRAAQYGFIERYPAGREHITRIAHEPWHFRYVGYPHSVLMRELELTLEEYTDYLQQFPYAGTRLHVRRDGREFAVGYVRADQERPVDVQVPEHVPAQISGNNVAGFVVTLWGSPA